jgi:hypothetical protein
MVFKLVTASAIAAGLVLPFTEDHSFGVWYAHRTSSTRPDWFNASLFVAPVLLVLLEWRLRNRWGRLVSSLCQTASVLLAGVFTQIALMGGGTLLIGAEVALAAIPAHALLSLTTCATYLVAPSSRSFANGDPRALAVLSAVLVAGWVAIISIRGLLAVVRDAYSLGHGPGLAEVSAAGALLTLALCMAAPLVMHTVGRRSGTAVEVQRVFLVASLLTSLFLFFVMLPWYSI